MYFKTDPHERLVARILGHLKQKQKDALFELLSLHCFSIGAGSFTRAVVCGAVVAISRGKEKFAREQHLKKS